MAESNAQDTQQIEDTPPQAALHLITGDENGLVKRTGFGPQASRQSEIWAKRQDRALEITSLSWKRTDEELLLSRKDGSVEVWNATSKDIVSKFQASSPSLVGAAYSNSSKAFVSCSNRGVVDVWRPDAAAPTENGDAGHSSFTVPVPNSSELMQMRLSQSKSNIFACGGKESPLKLYDINTQQRVFQAKNVPFTYLKLRVPIFIRDLRFVRSSAAAIAGNTFEIITVTSHKHVRLYDTRARRRAVRSVEFGEHALRSVCVTPDQNSVIVADTVGRMTRLNMADFRQISVFKGAGGSIRSMECHDSLPFVASVGLDRCARVHHLESRRLLQRSYLRGRLNCVLFEGHPDPEGEEVEGYNTLNSYNGARVIDENVAKDKGMVCLSLVGTVMLWLSHFRCVHNCHRNVAKAGSQHKADGGRTCPGSFGQIEAESRRVEEEAWRCVLVLCTHVAE